MENAKIAMRVVSSMILIVEDIIWIMLCDDFDKWWAKACLLVNILVCVGGGIVLAIWAWT